MHKAKKMISVLMILSLFLVTACASYHYEGGAAGGVLGGLTGALLDRKNPWRGGVIGAGIGALAGATIADISVRGSREAYRNNRPVEYRTDDGRGLYRAEPVGQPYYPDEQTKCKKVRERVYENGNLVKDTVREVCEGEKYERRY
ncbi:MAG: glycine zipper 2TM domain-containing protein [Nitrospirae bacterium]|nr:glycine zipper 2TM domain-containing protein [Nitrospirota bacterium]